MVPTWPANKSTMCEWLKCSDWCDVLLLCGGRFFNAHRAVLASVSSFLRRVLLSSPVDESPVFIFLPEFDLDAMSSVLYYIYNGEVRIPTHKIKMFLDIISAMEIFIDQQYIHPAYYEYKQYSLESNYNLNICQLETCNKINGYLDIDSNSIKSEKLIRQAQEPIVSLEACDKYAQTFRWSVKNIKDLSNLASLSGDQRNQLSLRDIFMEAVCQDGNVNGQTPGVLAISNEEYRAQTFDLFSNATNDLSSTFKKTYGQNHSKSTMFDFIKQIQDKNYIERNEGDISISYSAFNQVFNKSKSMLESNSNKEQDIDSWKRYTPLDISLPLMTRDSVNFPIKTQKSYLSLSHNEVTSNVKYSKVTKFTILNEVLQSPWHPRQPYSYRPFRKEDLYSVHVDKNNETEINVSYKDSNNNSETRYKINAIVVQEPVSSEKQELRCAVCQEVFTRSQDYTIHMKQHSSMNRYSCEECPKSFSQLRNFKYHMSVHRGTKEFAATCSVCGKHFNDRGYLSNHMKIHRNRKEYKCASCPKSFNQRVAFNMHVRIHTGVKPHVCAECGKAFSRKMLLRQHQRTHSGERPYACAHCDKRFADRSNMTLHLRLHTGVKPFSCTLCSKSFTKKHHLKSHLNSHTGARPYSCPRCKLAFTQSSNMRTHYKKCNAAS